MEAIVIDQFCFAKYTGLVLDRDIPLKPYNTYIIDGLPYNPVPFHARPLSERTKMNVIAIWSSENYIGKTVSFE